MPRSYAIVNTLAAIEAELGDLDRAVHDNWKAMELSGSSEPGDADWYVAGRIYEHLGLTGDATAAYRRIAKSTAVGVTSYSLAQGRSHASSKLRSEQLALRRIAEWLDALRVVVLDGVDPGRYRIGAPAVERRGE